MAMRCLFVTGILNSIPLSLPHTLYVHNTLLLAFPYTDIIIVIIVVVVAALCLHNVVSLSVRLQDNTIRTNSQ